MRKVLLFPETLKIWMNHIFTLYMLVSTLLVLFLVLIHISKNFSTSWTLKSFLQGIKPFIVKYKSVFVGITTVSLAWIITSLSFSVIASTGNPKLIPGDYSQQFGKEGETIVEIDQEWLHLGIEELYQDKTLSSKINLYLGLLALYILIIISLGGTVFTFSFGNRMLENIAIFHFYIAFLLLILGLLYQYRSNELMSLG